jgi:hypothetical protein
MGSSRAPETGCSVHNDQKESEVQQQQENVTTRSQVRWSDKARAA